MLSRMSAPTERTQVQGRLAANHRERPVAACLGFGPTGLLSCVSIDVGDDPHRPVVAAIPTDHPRVGPRISPFFPGDELPGDSYCGNCL